MHVWIWFRQFCSHEPIAKLAYLKLIPFISPLKHMYPFSVIYSSLQAFSLKNHDSSFLRKFRSFGIVLGIGAKLSVVVHILVFVLGLLICTFIRDLKIVVSLLKNKERRKEKKRKRFWFEHCVRIEFGSVGVWNCFNAWFWLIPHCSSISFGSLATYSYLPHLVLNSLQPWKVLLI